MMARSERASTLQDMRVDVYRCGDSTCFARPSFLAKSNSLWGRIGDLHASEDATKEWDGWSGPSRPGAIRRAVASLARKVGPASTAALKKAASPYKPRVDVRSGPRPTQVPHSGHGASTGGNGRHPVSPCNWRQGLGRTLEWGVEGVLASQRRRAGEALTPSPSGGWGGALEGQLPM